MIFVLGGEGYVGSAYPRLFESLGLPHTVITRANYDRFIGQSCDVFVNANGNSRKFVADEDPKGEFDASVRSVLHSLEDFKAGSYVFLSTGDVYPVQASREITREDGAIDLRAQSRYGFHKHMAEILVRTLHPRALVMRMGGFVGPGMKKNAIFDMLNDQPVWLTPDSELQFIRTDTAARLVWEAQSQVSPGEIVNLGVKGVIRIEDVHERLGSKSVYRPEARKVRFELSTEKLEAIVPDLPTTGGEIEAFFQSIGR